MNQPPKPRKKAEPPAPPHVPDKTTPEGILQMFWEHIDAEKSDMWHDLSAVGWVADDIVMALFQDKPTIGVFYRVTDAALQGVAVPTPHKTRSKYNVRDPRAYIKYRLKVSKE